MKKPLQYLSFTLLFIVSFLFFVYLTFPFNILKESLVMKLTKATGLNITVYDLSPSLLIGLEAKGVSLKSGTGAEVKFAEIDVSLRTLYLFVGQLRGVVEVYDANENLLEVVAGFSLFRMISDLSKGIPAIPSRIELVSQNFALDDLIAYALGSYMSSPKANQLVVPLLEQMAIRGSMNTNISLDLDLDDPASSDGSLDLGLDKFVLALNAPGLEIEDQRFERAGVKANLTAGNLQIQEGSEFSSQDIAVNVSGEMALKTPIQDSTMNISMPVLIRGALKNQFGFLIDAMLKGTTDGEIPLQIRGTLRSPSVSYN